MSKRKSRPDHLAENLEILIEARAQPEGGARAAALKAYYFPNENAWYDTAFIFVNWGLAAVLLPLILPHLLSWRFLWQGPLLIVISFYVADLMSAVFHKWLDSYACEQNPFWGTSAKAFRVHHEFPNNLNGTTYLHNVSAFATFSTFLYGLMLAAILVGSPQALNLVLWIMLLLFTNGTEIHKQAHRPHPPAFFRMAQATGFFLRRKNHLRHHRDELNSDYGIINGWSNGLAARFDLWRRLDGWAWRYFDVLPRNWVQAPPSVPAAVLRSLEMGERPLPQEFLIYLRAFPKRASEELRAVFGRLSA